MEKFFESLCWNITGKCNEDCKFCYRRKCMDNTLEENIKIFDNLSKNPIKKISFCGGEPLLYTDLFALVKYIRNKFPNIKLSITTNGKCIDDSILEQIFTYFDWISFPIDSSNAEMNAYIGRGYNHLPKIIHLLEKCNNQIHIKINTVVTKVNKEDIQNIYRIISAYHIDRWKIFRFFPIRDAKRYQDLFYLNQFEASQVQNFIQTLNKESCFSIEYNDFEGKPSCFSIQPNGTIENSENEVIGNALEDDILGIKRLELVKYQKTSY